MSEFIFSSTFISCNQLKKSRLWSITSEVVVSTLMWTALCVTSVLECGNRVREPEGPTTPPQDPNAGHLNTITHSQPFISLQICYNIYSSKLFSVFHEVSSTKLCMDSYFPIQTTRPICRNSLNLCSYLTLVVWITKFLVMGYPPFPIFNSSVLDLNVSPKSFDFWLKRSLGLSSLVVN
jgi:hypothetical protein